MARRRTKGEGSIFEKPKGSGIWYAQVTLPSGKQVQRRGAARRRLARLCVVVGQLRPGGRVGAVQTVMCAM